MNRYLALIFSAVAFITANFLAATAPTPDSRGSFNIAIIMPTTPKDRSWGQSMVDSLGSIKNGSGDMPALNITVLEKILTTSKFENTLRKYAAGNYDLIIAHSPSYKDSVFNIAREFPGVSFAVAAKPLAIKSENISPNIFIYNAEESEAGYVNGVIAALSLDFVLAGVVVPDGDREYGVDGYVEGFRNGLLTTSPASDVKVNYVQSPWDINYSIEAASLLILNDVHILTGIFPQAIGALHIGETNEIPWVGVECDVKSAAPCYVLASQVYCWDAIFKDIIMERQNGKLGNKTYTINFANGGIKTVFNNAAMKDNEDVKAVVKKVTKGIIEGYIKPLEDDY